MSVGRSVGRSVGPSITFLNSERFSHYCSCPTVRDWIAVYPALFTFRVILSVVKRNHYCSWVPFSLYRSRCLLSNQLRCLTLNCRWLLFMKVHDLLCIPTWRILRLKPKFSTINVVYHYLYVYAFTNMGNFLLLLLPLLLLLLRPPSQIPVSRPKFRATI